MSAITFELLCKIAPQAKRSPRTATALAAAYSRHLPKHQILNRLEVCMFLANTAVETGGFRRLSENMNYSAARLMKVWPNRFKSRAQANKYARQPRKLANHVYGGRLGNRGQNTDDGWQYRGSGPMQTTGRHNFGAVQAVTGLPVLDKPDLLRDPDRGTQAACIYWVQNNCGASARRDDTLTNRRKINGGTHGLDDMRTYYARAKRYVTDEILRELVGGAVADPHVRPVMAKPLEVFVSSTSPREVVKAAQSRLAALNYSPGGIDGIWGGLTRAALLAFKADNGLDTSRAMVALKVLRAGKPRVLESRQMATLADLDARGSETRSGNKQVKQVGGTLVGLATAYGGSETLTGASDTVGKVEQGVSLLQRVQSLVEPLQPLLSVLQDYWWLAAILFGGLLWYRASKSDANRLKQHISGKHL